MQDGSGVEQEQTRQRWLLLGAEKTVSSTSEIEDIPVFHAGETEDRHSRRPLVK